MTLESKLQMFCPNFINMYCLFGFCFFSSSLHNQTLFFTITFIFKISGGMSAQEVLTTLNYSSLHLLSDTYFLSTLCLWCAIKHTHAAIDIHTLLSRLCLVTHTLVFRGYQSAECKLSPPKTVTCRQRCLAPCGNPLSSWHKNKSLFPW